VVLNTVIIAKNCIIPDNITVHTVYRHSIVVQYFIYHNIMQIKSKTVFSKITSIIIYLTCRYCFQFPYFIVCGSSCNTKFETPVHHGVQFGHNIILSVIVIIQYICFVISCVQFGCSPTTIRNRTTSRAASGNAISTISRYR
jgi:hypothetical protein